MGCCGGAISLLGNIYCQKSEVFKLFILSAVVHAIFVAWLGGTSMALILMMCCY
jgi:tRNA A22 N-methylase